MRINIVLVWICLLTIVLNCGCLENRESKVITMTMEELISDYNKSIDDNAKKITNWYESLDEGDTLIISDTIDNITYIESDNYTLIKFESLLGQNLEIGGNITNRFWKGDNIEVKMHIIRTTYKRQVYGETWTIELETFKEGWDSENNTSIPLPQKCVEGVESKVVIMTMEELINDYTHKVDNDTKRITYSLKSLSEGDTLIIKDTLNDATYNGPYNYTSIDFETMVGYPSYIEGNITDTFKEGDSIELTLHVIKITFTEEIYGEIWIIKQETFKEVWDSENNTFIPIPQEYITHV